MGKNGTEERGARGGERERERREEKRKGRERTRCGN